MCTWYLKIVLSESNQILVVTVLIYINVAGKCTRVCSGEQFYCYLQLSAASEIRVERCILSSTRLLVHVSRVEIKLSRKDVINCLERWVQR